MSTAIYASALGGAIIFGSVVIAAGAGLTESVSLACAKCLAKHNNTASRIAKFALGALALASAVVVTGTLGYAAIFTILLCFPSVTSAVFAQILGMGLAAAITVPLHWKAFSISFYLHR